MNLIRHKLFKNSLIYSGSNIINRAIPFLFLPVLTRYLSPNDYGIIATFHIVNFFCTIIIGVNTHGALSTNYFKLEPKELKVYTYNLFYIIGVGFCLVLGIFLIAGHDIASSLKIPTTLLIIILFNALFEFVSTLILTLWQVEEKSFFYGIFQITKTATNIAISLFFIIILQWNWWGRVGGVLISSAIYALISLIILFKCQYLKFSFNLNYIKDALNFGIPLIPHSLSGWIMTASDRIFINSMIGVADTGIYTVGYQVGNIIGLLATSFNKAVTPYIYQKITENKLSLKIKIVKFTYLYYLTIILLALSLSYIAPIILKYFVSQEFQSASKYVIWIALGYAANGMYYMVVKYIFYIKKTYILAWVTFTSAIVNLILNYFLIKANGAIGAAQATTITLYLTFISVWFLSAQVYHMPWAFWRYKNEKL